MERIQELLAKLGELTQAELDELSTLIAAEVDEVAAETPSADSADALTALADAHDQVVAEQGRRDAEQEEVAARHAEQLARIRPAATEPAEGEGEGEAAEGEPAAAEGDAPAGDAPAEGEAATEPIAASAQPTRPTLAQIASRRPANRSPQRRANADEGGRALVAAANGNELRDMNALALAFEDTRNRFGKAGARADGEQVIVASAQAEYPEDRRLGNDPVVNAERIRALTSPQAIVAAGGLCAPLQNVYDVQVLGVTDRPVRGSLPNLEAPRGGVSLRPAQQFQDWDASHGEWTLATDANPSSATKAVLEVVCSSFEDFEVGAVTLGLKFHNIAARTDPEGTAANIQASEVAFARFAENRLLLQMYGMSKNVTGGTVRSFARDALFHIDRLVAYMRNRHRLSDTTKLRYWLPRWVKDGIRADLVLGIAGGLDAFAIADQMINDWFTARNVNVTWHLDGRIADLAASGGAPAVAKQSYATLANNSVIPAFPAQIEGVLAIEGDFVFLDSGELNLGLVRDSTLNAVNEYQTFFEEFNGIAFKGAEAFHTVMTLAPSGAAAGLDVTVNVGS